MKIVASAALAAAFLVGGSIAAYATDRGGVMTYGRYADSLFLDPVLNDANVDIWILSNIYDTLLLPTDDGQGVQPGLATEWKVSDDGLSVTLKLRDGIKFSDGSPIEASDVIWSLKRAATPDFGIWGFLVSAIKDHSRPHRVQHRDHAAKVVRGDAGQNGRRKGQGVCRTSDRLRPLHVRVVGAWVFDEAGQEPLLLGLGR
jgi:ABC-type transport system substrate-binding protein